MRTLVKSGSGGDKLKAEVEFIENAINALPESDYKVMLAVFVDKRSLRSVAKSFYMSHSGLRYKIEKTINEIAELHKTVFS